MKKPLLIAAAALLAAGASTGVLALANAAPTPTPTPVASAAPTVKAVATTAPVTPVASTVAPAATTSAPATTSASVAPGATALPVAGLSVPGDDIVNAVAGQLQKDPGAVRAAFQKVIDAAKAQGGDISTTELDARLAKELGTTVEELRKAGSPRQSQQPKR